MPLVQSGQTVRPVLLRILGVADADQGEFQQPHGGRQHLVAGDPRSGQIGFYTPPEFRQRPGKGGHPFELGLRGVPAPAVMIAILFAALHITTRRLDVAAGARRNPDVGPCGRNSQGADALQNRLVTDQGTFGVMIGKARARTRARQTGPIVAAPRQPLGNFRPFAHLQRTVRHQRLALIEPTPGVRIHVRCSLFRGILAAMLASCIIGALAT